MKRPPSPPDKPDPIDTYRQAMRAGDPDGVHQAFVSRGMDALANGVPYLVQAARWQQASARRRELRRQGLMAAEGENALENAPSIEGDPYERVARDEVVRRVMGALAALSDEDVLVVWAMCEGQSDHEIAAEWKRRGYQPADPTVELIRQRRHRALGRLREAIGAKAK